MERALVYVDDSANGAAGRDRWPACSPPASSVLTTVLEAPPARQDDRSQGRDR